MVAKYFTVYNLLKIPYTAIFSSIFANIKSSTMNIYLYAFTLSAYFLSYFYKAERAENYVAIQSFQYIPLPLLL